MTHSFRDLLLFSAIFAVHFPMYVISFGLHCSSLVISEQGEQTASGSQVLQVLVSRNCVGLTAVKKSKQATEESENIHVPEMQPKRKLDTKIASIESTTTPLHWIHPADPFIYQEEIASDVQPTGTNNPNQIQFTVRGQPLALKRHRTGNGFLYNPSAKAQQSFSATVAGLLANHASPLFPLDQYLIVSIIFYFKRPKNHYVGNKVEPLRLRSTAPLYTKAPPDVDNLAKFVLDSMNGLLFHDDRQVVSLHVTKVYGDVPSTRITVQKLCPRGDSSFPFNC